MKNLRRIYLQRAPPLPPRLAPLPPGAAGVIAATALTAVHVHIWLFPLATYHLDDHLPLPLLILDCSNA